MKEKDLVEITYRLGRENYLKGLFTDVEILKGIPQYDTVRINKEYVTKSYNMRMPTHTLNKEIAEVLRVNECTIVKIEFKKFKR